MATSKYAAFIDQKYYAVPSFTLECGRVLREVPVAYKTWGELNAARNNVMVICHAFTGSADVEDWWGPLMGPGKAFDPTRYFIFCGNVMGSPYGTASSVTINPDTGVPYGPEFPLTTIRDDVRLHKLVLDHLGVAQVAVAIGGSMGGMAALEWPLCTEAGFVRRVIPIATSARHSAWCISWGEAQRQSIYSDPAYEDGYYAAGTQPHSGLAAARMAALLTYRSRDSFESRFGRKPHKHANGDLNTLPVSQQHRSAEAVAVHNDGNKKTRQHPLRSSSRDPNIHGTSTGTHSHASHKTPIFSAQSYLRYQGDKFISRFDANCYIHITRKMDTHDIARGRVDAHPQTPTEESVVLAESLAKLPPALVIGVQSDGLFLLSEQRELAEHIPEAELAIIQSPDGHDGFLLEFEQLNGLIIRYLKREYPGFYREGADDVPIHDFEVKKTSMFGEAEVDVTRW